MLVICISTKIKNVSSVNLELKLSHSCKKKKKKVFASGDTIVKSGQKLEMQPYIQQCIGYKSPNQTMSKAE